MKKIILSLFVGLIGIVSFCSSSFYGYSTGNYFTLKLRPLESGNIDIVIPSNDFLAFQYQNGNIECSYSGFYFPPLNKQVNLIINDSSSDLSVSVECYAIGGNQGTYQNTWYWLGSLSNFSSSSSCPECEVCQECSYSGYILESEIDTNYCIENGYCPNSCGSGGDFSGDLQFSNLYINDILHPGKENIFVNIPDYITWDYSTTTGDFNIYVGSGYDMDYMKSIIDINSYRPDSGDFTNIFVSGLTLIFPYIFVALLIVFMWKLLKRIFR